MFRTHLINLCTQSNILLYLSISVCFNQIFGARWAPTATIRPTTPTTTVTTILPMCEYNLFHINL